MFNFFKEYFKLSNTEFKGILLLIVLIALVFISPKVVSLFRTSEQIDDSNFLAWVASFEVTEEIEDESNAFDLEEKNQYTYQNSYDKKDNFSYQEDEYIEIVLRDFDPNTATYDEFRSLGIPANVSHTIINFRESGGKFYKAEDLKKVYGITDEIYTSLETYIQIPAQAYFHEEEVEDIVSEPVIVNINTADSASLTQLKGIGKTYAARIVKYRDLLGGFTTKIQLKEVYGVEDELYNSLVDNIIVTGIVEKLDINLSSIDELKSHPYIDYTTAKAIVNYREQHGMYNSVDDLSNLYALDDVLLGKIIPYLKVKE